jgi:hypothetical protein
LGIAIPARVEGEHVFFEHALEKTDHAIAILHDQPILRGVSAEDFKAEFLVERPRSLDILHRQADRKCAEFYSILSPS